VAWLPIFERAAAGGATVHAVDLPGVGSSTRGSIGAAKHELAAVMVELAEVTGWAHPRLVGHDIGGMVAYAALRAAPVFERMATCNTVIPGVSAWDHVYGSPQVFHFRGLDQPSRWSNGYAREALLVVLRQLQVTHGFADLPIDQRIA
jgi:pimeloyl-ACP methyl ester carboxylesterase